MRVAINGFGRIGRVSLRVALEKSGIEVVAINDLTDNKTMAHLFQYDSVHGVFSGDVSLDGDDMKVSGQTIKILSERDPKKLPWKELNIDLVLECTGFFTLREGASGHIEAGAKKVLISGPTKSPDVPMIVLGVNDDKLTGSEDIVSNASCTTNCLAPMVKVLDDTFGLEKGFITTIHAYTSTQSLQDKPDTDLRRARAATVSMIPTSTGAASAVGKVLPHLNGKLDGKAIRVPVPDGSITDFVGILSKDATVEEVNAAFKKASEGSMKGVLSYNTDPIVSIDIVGNPYSCIVDSDLTMANGKLVKVYGWYDNEMGYSSRLIELGMKMLS